jgi:hypothetical protein
MNWSESCPMAGFVISDVCLDVLNLYDWSRQGSNRGLLKATGNVMHGH